MEGDGGGHAATGGSSISPLLANVYLHYALDLWVMDWRRQARGNVIMVRYADDAVLGFENRDEAESLRRNCKSNCGRSDWNCTRRRPE